MNSRFLIVLIFALVLAGEAAWMAKQWMDSQTGPKQVTAEQNTVRIYAAATNIPADTRIEKTQIKLMEWPKNNVPSGAFTEADVQADPNAIIGKVAQSQFYTDEILLKPQIKEHAGLSSSIKEGMRAMSVRVNDVTGVAGFTLPGNFADIIIFRDGKTFTLLQNIKILAFDQSASTDQNKPAVAQTLTLEVKPEDASKLVQEMQAGGTLQFTLRNPMDSVTRANIEPTEPPKDIKKVSLNAPPTILILPWTSEKFDPPYCLEQPIPACATGKIISN